MKNKKKKKKKVTLVKNFDLWKFNRDNVSLDRMQEKEDTLWYI